MPGNLTNYSESKLVDHLLGTTAYTKPTSVYISLYTIAPTESSSGTEVTGGSYARQLATFAPASNGVATNNTLISFTSMPACTVVAIGVTDLSSNGNLLLYGNLSSSITVIANDTLQISNGALTVSLD